MNVPALALLTRSLRLESRSTATYLGRLALGAVILVPLFYAWQMSVFIAAPGLEFFGIVVNIDVVFIILAGIGFFSTCITEEKDDGTLGLLRMTNLSPVSILLGKTGGRLLGGTLLILVQVPFTLLAITLGGVALQQIAAAYLSLLALILMVAGVGLLVSAITPRSRTAVGRMMALVFLYFFIPGVGPPTLDALAARLGWSALSYLLHPAAEFLSWVHHANIFADIQREMASGIGTPLIATGTILNTATGVAGFLLAWLTFDLFNQRDAESGPTRPRGLWRRKANADRQPRRAWAGARAIIWKEFYFTGGGPTGLVIQGVFFGLIIVLIFLVDHAAAPNMSLVDQLPHLGAVLVALFLTVLSFEALVLAGRIFNEEVQGRTLASLILLPIPLTRIAYAKVLGTLPVLLPAALCVLVGAFLATDSIMRAIYRGFFEGPSGWVTLALVVCTLHLVAFLSLYVRWAALPLAILIMFGAHVLTFIVVAICAMAVTGFFGSGGGYVLVALWLMALIGVTVVLHLGIGRRLAKLAQE